MENLTLYLQRSGLTQAQLAERVGVNQASISKMCRGVISPDIHTAIAIEQATGGKVPVEAWPAFAVLAERKRHRRTSTMGAK